MQTQARAQDFSLESPDTKLNSRSSEGTLARAKELKHRARSSDKSLARAKNQNSGQQPFAPKHIQPVTILPKTSYNSNTKSVVNASLRSIVEDARHLLKRCKCFIQHILREGNQCADKLANLGADQEKHLVVMEDPPEEVRSLVVADLLGREYQRL
ncbi:hypothetical protein ACSBR2_031725 [Camellia fascicularis]